MTWRKLGHVYVADGARPWAASHAYVPTPLLLEDDRIRVFCAFLDREGIGRVGWVDVDARSPTRVLGVSADPALDIGAPGAFDDNGVTPLSLVVLPNGRLRLYYAGWQLGHRVRYLLFTGVAEADAPDAPFRRVFRSPVLDRSDGELTLRSSVHVRPGGGGWRMWYAGSSEWIEPDGRPALPRYPMRYLESRDGLTWGASGRVVMAPAGDDEHGFTRPSVVEEGRLLRMWFSLRTLSRGYRIAYAESHDGLAWERRDDRAGIDVSDHGWDSEEVATAAVLDTPGGRLLFYNGNGYGRTGFGVAVADA